MCGLTGFVGEPPADVVERAVAGAARRGPHTHGWATWAGEWGVRHGDGPLTPSVVPGLATVGHSRLATSGRQPGTVPSAADGQPLLLDGHVLAHNGRVTNDEILDTFPAAIDSGSLLAAICAGELVQDLLDVASDGPHALIVGAPTGDLTVARWAGRNGRPAHPLYFAGGRSWSVVSSAPLPGGALLAEGIHHVPAR